MPASYIARADGRAAPLAALFLNSGEGRLVDPGPLYCFFLGDVLGLVEFGLATVFFFDLVTFFLPLCTARPMRPVLYTRRPDAGLTIVWRPMCVRSSVQVGSISFFH